MSLNCIFHRDKGMQVVSDADKERILKENPEWVDHPNKVNEPFLKKDNEKVLNDVNAELKEKEHEKERRRDEHEKPSRKKPGPSERK